MKLKSPHHNVFTITTAHALPAVTYPRGRGNPAMEVTDCAMTVSAAIKRVNNLNSYPHE
jgi:hypothetical protein